MPRPEQKTPEDAAFEAGKSQVRTVVVPAPQRSGKPEEDVIRFPGRVPQFGVGVGDQTSWFGRFNRHLITPDGRYSLRIAYSALVGLCGRKSVEEVFPGEDEENVWAVQWDARLAAAGALATRTTLVVASNWEVQGHGFSEAAQPRPGSSRRIIAAGYPDYKEVADGLRADRGFNNDIREARWKELIWSEMGLIVGVVAGYTFEQMADAEFVVPEYHEPPVPGEQSVQLV